ncbi:MAG: sensor histidine kinase [Bdellovibrionota bacterium]
MNKLPVKLSFRQAKAAEIFSVYFRNISTKVDQLFGVLFLFQWLLGIAIAFWAAPQQGTVQHYLFLAVFAGGLLAALPVYLNFFRAGKNVNRYVNAIAQIIFSTLFMRLTGGRIETHFHIFGSLAFLAFYRDWKVVALATLVTAFDHLLRGVFWPASMYGEFSAGLGRVFEHAAWLIFEDFVLFFAIRTGLRELKAISEKQAALEHTIAFVEEIVTERTIKLIESEQKIIDQHQALMASAKMSALGEMAGGMAHEINNPLAIIMAVSSQLCELMNQKEIERPTVTTMAETILRTSDRIAKIVAGLRTFCRDSRRDPLIPVLVQHLVDSTVGLCSERFRNNQVELIIDSIPKDLEFDGRETQVSQVLLNLLNNAYDAISEKKEKWIRISVIDAGAKIRIAVTDSGDGVPADVRKKIFQPFFTTKDVGKGTGMGLSISLGILQAHRGTITLNENSPNTSFLIELPKKFSEELKAG